MKTHRKISREPSLLASFETRESESVVLYERHERRADLNTQKSSHCNSVTNVKTKSSILESCVKPILISKA